MIWFVLLLGLAGYIAYDYWWKPRQQMMQEQRPRRRASFDERPPVPQDLTGHSLNLQMQMWEQFNEDYIFIMPRYGLYKGKRVPLEKVTPEMMADPAFARPADLGHWFKRPDYE